MADRVSIRYNTPATPGSFQGPHKAYISAKQAGIQDLTRKEIKESLQKEETYTLNRAVNTKFPRNRVIVEGIDSQWDTDLADLTLLSSSNNGYKHILLMIDIFSRHIWVQALKTKLSEEIIKAMDRIFQLGRQPNSMRTDGGRELNNVRVKKFLNKKGIHHFITHNSTQANYSERAIKTIKSKLYRYMIHNNSLRYIDVLQDIAKSYNNTIHSSLGRPPVEVNKTNEGEVRYKQYLLRRKKTHKQQTFKLNLGDKVRMFLAPEKFDREYGQKWTGEVFLISERRMRRGIPIYKVKDWNGDPIEGTFYQQELQKVNVSDHDLFKIEKVLKRRRRNGANQVFVKFLHWPKKFNAWINEDAVNLET